MRKAWITVMALWAAGALAAPAPAPAAGSAPARTVVARPRPSATVAPKSGAAKPAAAPTGSAKTPSTAAKPAAANVETAAGTNTPVSADAVRAFLSKWVETEQLVAKERREAEQSKDILAARIETLKEGVTALNERIAQADEKLVQAQKLKADVVVEMEKNNLAAAQLGAGLAGLESHIRALHPALPSPLTEKIRTLYDRMPADTNNVRVSVAERCQNVLGILNEVNKFNAELTMVYDVRNLSDGKPSEVSCLYVGLGQAYSVSPRGEAAVGRPGPQGWVWTAVPGSAEAITRTMEILQNKAKPEFVPLPVEMKP